MKAAAVVVAFLLILAGSAPAHGVQEEVTPVVSVGDILVGDIPDSAGIAVTASLVTGAWYTDSFPALVSAPFSAHLD